MQKLELTWIGKGKEPAVEPRILLHDPSKDYGDPNAENMLIHGDNLLALKALEQQYTGKVKCIYIDPPYNTGAAFEHYDDNLEHSIWLKLMKSRLEILKNLLSPDGTICVQIDAIEMAYLKVLMDEVFMRSNFLNMISVKTKIAGVSGSNMGKSLQDNIEYILLYAKNKSFVQLNPIYIKQKLFTRIKNYKEEGKSWKYTSVMVNLADKELIKEDSERGMKFYGYKTLETMSISAFAKSKGITESEVYNKYADRIDACMKNEGLCIQRDDMGDILKAYQQADILVLATPVYFYGISAQMKTFIDRTYPIWQNLGHKNVYYIISAGLGEDIINRSLGDLDGFVEHLDDSKVKGRIYATNVMDAGLVKEQEDLLERAYEMGKSII